MNPVYDTQVKTRVKATSVSMRKRLTPWGLALFFLLALSSCTQKPDINYVKGEVNGYVFEIYYHHPDPNFSHKQMHSRVSGLLGYLIESFSASVQHSEISRINQWESTEPIFLTRELENFIFTALEIDDLTQGDLRLFGAYSSGSKTLEVSNKTLQPWIRVENHQVIKSHPLVELNVEGLLEGYLADRLAVLMSQLRIEQYQVVINYQVRSRKFKGMARSQYEALSAPTQDFPVAGQAQQNNNEKGRLKRSRRHTQRTDTLLPAAYEHNQQLRDTLAHYKEKAHENMTVRFPGLGYAYQQFGPKLQIAYVVGATTTEAASLAKWLVRMPLQDALLIAERLNLAVSILIAENDQVMSYNTSVFQ